MRIIQVWNALRNLSARTLGCKLARVPVSAFETICQAESRRKKAEKVDTRSKVARRRNVLRVSLPFHRGEHFFRLFHLPFEKLQEKKVWRFVNDLTQGVARALSCHPYAQVLWNSQTVTVESNQTRFRSYRYTANWNRENEIYAAREIKAYACLASKL